MNYAYTSARVRALENSLPSPEMIRQLAEAGNIKECIGILNGSGFEGSEVNEIISRMKERRERLINELIDDTSEIEVIFYQKSFHNLKAAIKKLYSKQRSDMFYDDAPVSGEEIMEALQNGNEASLPGYMSKAAEEGFRALMRTGDGRLSDMIADRACLEAMAEFAEKTKHEILKRYVNETIAAADIRLLLRAGESRELMDYAVSCAYFSKNALIKAADEGTAEEFLKAAGFEGVTSATVDAYSERRIAQILAGEKYNIFSPAPAINFILEFDRAAGIIRYILICKANGIDREKILERVRSYV
ncbi:MAG: V-type ATPase subunit [bacterium]|nr:V-type ATPase subunit [bacterium]